jgi:hypothetical protein
MATETSVPASNRPRPWLLILLALTVAAYAVSRIFSGPSAPAPVPTTSGTRPGRGAANGPVDPKELDVRVESLNQKPPPLGEGDRNPFRFQPKPPPEPPPGAYTAPVTKPVEPVVPPTPPPPEVPRIGDTVKFIGVVETARGKIGAFSIWDPQTRECRGVPTPGREGDVIEGRYRVVRLGIESAVLTYLDGKGQATLPLNGQACVVKQ